MLAASLAPKVPDDYRNLSRSDITRENDFTKGNYYVVAGCPFWSEILSLGLRSSDSSELRFVWVAQSDLRRLAARRELFFAGVSYRRTAQDPKWEPEKCMPRVSAENQLDCSSLLSRGPCAPHLLWRP